MYGRLGNRFWFFHHKHDLVESQGASLPEASLRQIPEDYITLGHELNVWDYRFQKLIRYLLARLTSTDVWGGLLAHNLAELDYWGPFSPMFSKKVLNLKRERPPHFFFWQNTTAHEQSRAITLNYQDIFNRFQPSSEVRRFDATNFVEYLQKRYKTSNLYFAI